MNGPSICIKELSVQIQNNLLLSPFDLTFPAAQWHGIAGPNGGGKSTLLKAVTGLLDHRGKIEIHWPTSNQKIGYMPQQAAFEASLPITTLDYIRMHGDTKPIWKKYTNNKNVENVIETMAIQHLLSMRIGTLSTGERQRVLLACALIHKPSLLLLDEPMAGMDTAGKDLMIEYLKAFKSEGGTILMIEHDRKIIQQCCDTASWFNGGLSKHFSDLTTFDLSSGTKKTEVLC